MSDIFVNYANEDRSFSLSHKKTTGHYTMAHNHFHDGYELFYLLGGERYYFIKERTFFVQKGDLVLINPYDLHKTIDTGMPDHERILLKFSRSFISTPSISCHQELLSPLFNIPLIRLSASAQACVEETFQKMLQEIKLKKSCFEIRLQSLLLQLLIYARRFLEAHPAVTPEHPSPNHQKVSEIVRHINRSYAEDITLSTVAKRFFISPYYLSRTFKEVTGFTFIEYLNSVRIKEAQRLLRESRDNVSSIAEKVGFGSIAHFGRVFKSVTGQAPLHYRKINRS